MIDLLSNVTQQASVNTIAVNGKSDTKTEQAFSDTFSDMLKAKTEEPRKASAVTPKQSAPKKKTTEIADESAAAAAVSGTAAQTPKTQEAPKDDTQTAVQDTSVSETPDVKNISNSPVVAEADAQITDFDIEPQDILQDAATQDVQLPVAQDIQAAAPQNVPELAAKDEMPQITAPAVVDTEIPAKATPAVQTVAPAETEIPVVATAPTETTAQTETTVAAQTADILTPEVKKTAQAEHTEQTEQSSPVFTAEDTEGYEALERMTTVTDTESTDTATAELRHDDAMGHVFNMRVRRSEPQKTDTADVSIDTDTEETPPVMTAETESPDVEETIKSADTNETAAPAEESSTDKKETKTTHTETAKESVFHTQSNEFKPHVNTAAAKEAHFEAQNAQQARNVIEQIVQASAMTRQDGTSRLEIQLKPEFLGKLSVVLTSTSEGVNAQLKAGNDATRSMLQSHLPELQTALKNMGIDMKNIEITDNKAGWDFSNNGGQPKQDPRQSDKQQNREQTIRKIRNSMSIPLIPNIAPYGAVRNAYIRDEDVSVEFLA